MNFFKILLIHSMVAFTIRTVNSIKQTFFNLDEGTQGF